MESSSTTCRFIQPEAAEPKMGEVIVLGHQEPSDTLKLQLERYVQKQRTPYRPTVGALSHFGEVQAPLVPWISTFGKPKDSDVQSPSASKSNIVPKIATTRVGSASLKSVIVL